MKRVLLATTAVLMVASAFAVASFGVALAADIALSGQVSSAKEGPMEGVLVSAQRAGSTITIYKNGQTQGQLGDPSPLAGVSLEMRPGRGSEPLLRPILLF